MREITMERKYNLPKGYPSSIGGREIEVIARLSYENTDIITLEKFREYFGQDGDVQLIYQLRKKGILRPIKRGVYWYSPLEAGPYGRGMCNNLIPPIFFPKKNYYIGYFTEYNTYGFTEQIPQITYVLNTSYQCKKNIDGMCFEFIKVSSNRMYGLEKRNIFNTEVLFSDKERTLVDLFYFPDPVGGLRVAFKVLSEQIEDNSIDLDKFINYAVMFPSKSTRKRIGYVLDLAKVPNSKIQLLIESIKNTSLITLFGSQSRKGAINNKWRVIIDVA
ncbi:MAG: type IV toxin-antitoxin system AbiEi family antitoxin [Candidatus Firestonebacteria bacterium]